ncbi:MAG: efflux RND transporter periplasmic adaptor subunit, partial [Flammeovirgaceae bacterium]
MKKKSSNKRLWIILSSIIGVLIIGLVVLKQMGVVGQRASKKVQIAEVKDVTIVEKVSASGKVQPVDEVKISPEVSGEIKELYIEEGDSVKEGQLLARIRPDNLQSALERTKATLNTQRANLAQAKARMAQTKAQFIRSKQDYERNKKLHEQKVISDADFASLDHIDQVAAESIVKYRTQH